MAADGNETTAGETERTEQSFMALPDATEDTWEPFATRLVEVVRILGLDVVPEPQPGGPLTWEHRARAALREACRQGMGLSEAAFDALVKAAVHDPNPSLNRGFIEPALNAFGRGRVRSALLGYLRTGSDLERAGAARAWYWSALPLRMTLVRAKSPGFTGQAEPDDGSAGAGPSAAGAPVAQTIRQRSSPLNLTPTLPRRTSIRSIARPRRSRLPVADTGRVVGYPSLT
ncbi:hypothetical protein [Actinacidiphila sp. bgisy167]|uniref:hypothetical protein n=1 Tax=Actinacidiphila sp. bgisy167 TaxID=3413797 RepID=UPI003D75CEBA